MNSYTSAVYTELENLTKDSKALLSATANAADHAVVETRKRLIAGLENSRRALARMQEQAVEGARMANEQVRHHPYQALGFAFGTGLVLGCLLTRRN